MNRRQFLKGTGLLAAGAALGGGAWSFLREQGLVERRRRFRALGAQCELTVLHEDAARADRALAAAETLVHRLESIFSIYDPDSEVSRLNRDGELRAPSYELYDLLLMAGTVSHLTGGAFDVTVQPLWTAAAAGRDPREALHFVGFLQLTETRERIRFSRPGVAITLNGIAQGYITDAVHDTLAAEGIEHALVNCGEFLNLGNREPGARWRLGIQHPTRRKSYLGVIEADGRAVATSGNYHARRSPGRAHCFDPRTGLAVHHWQSLTVVDDAAVLADAHSTALFVMQPDEAAAFCEAHAELGVLAVQPDGRVLRTDAFPPFVA